ncbi:MAG: LysR family transcriptional regulator [Firmicutes bacterium]|nr:LysR family transcriptional regulator [Bacillota bacterium]
MDLQKSYDLYRTFITLYEVKKYSLCAEKLHYSSHSSVVNNIKALAEQVGVDKLFIGHYRGVTPTEKAIHLYNRVKPLFDEIDNAEKEIKEFTSESHATIRVIMPATMCGIVLGKFFKDFNNQYPNIKFKILNVADKESYDLFCQGRVDLIIALEHVCKQYNLKTIDILPSDYILIASKKFLEERSLTESITFEEFIELPLVGHYGYLKEAITNQKIKANIFIETATVEPVYKLVESNVGIGLYYEQLFNRQKNDDLVRINVSGLKLSSNKLVCGYNEDLLTKPTQIFLDRLKQFLDT